MTRRKLLNRAFGAAISTGVVVAILIGVSIVLDGATLGVGLALAADLGYLRGVLLLLTRWG